MQLYKNERFVAYSRAQLKELADGIQGVEAVLLSSSDGFEIASEIVKHTNSQAAPDKLAAVSSSLMALGMSLAAECGLENGKSVIIDAQSGKVTLFPLVAGDTSMILLVQSGSSSMLGHILHGSSKCGRAIIEEARRVIQGI